MPINYKDYPPNWKTEIRPRILERAQNKCEFCGVENHNLIIRGNHNGLEAYQDMDGFIYNADNSVQIGSDYIGEIHATNGFIRVVLTVAHLNHDINDNRDENLRALCQMHHNRHDLEHRKANRKKKQPELF